MILFLVNLSLVPLFLVLGCTRDNQRINDNLFEAIELNQRKQLEIDRLKGEKRQLVASIQRLQIQLDDLDSKLRHGQVTTEKQAENNALLSEREKGIRELLDVCRSDLARIELENLDLKQKPEDFFSTAEQYFSLGGVENLTKARKLVMTIIDRFPLSHLRSQSKNLLERIDRLLLVLNREKKHREMIERDLKEQETYREQFGRNVNCGEMFITANLIQGTLINFRASVHHLSKTGDRVILDCAFLTKEVSFMFMELPSDNRQWFLSEIVTKDHFLFVGQFGRDDLGNPEIKGVRVFP